MYDKFVLFLENLEKVGKNIEQARSTYQETYKQLYTGNDQFFNFLFQTNPINNAVLEAELVHCIFSQHAGAVQIPVRLHASHQETQILKNRYFERK